MFGLSGSTMFGLSGSKSRSSSTGVSNSTSFSFGNSGSLQGSQSSSVSGGSSVAGSSDQATARSNQTLAFEDVFSRLFGNAEGVAGNLDTSLLTQASNQLFAGGTDFLSSIGGDVGTSFLTDRLGAGNDVLNGQLDLLQSDIGDLFREELLPGITSEAVAAGQLGGGRQGVAQAGAADAAAEAFTRGAVDLRTRDQAQRDAIAQGIAGRSIEGAQVGLAGMPGLLNIAQGGITAQTAPMQFLASILGDKSILTDSSSQSTGQSFSNAMDFARSLAESFGSSFSQDRAGSQSSSRTQSNSSSNSFGIGF